jgi:hypothetical protein
MYCECRKGWNSVVKKYSCGDCKPIEELRRPSALEQWWIIQIYLLRFPIRYRSTIKQPFVFFGPGTNVRHVCRKTALVEISRLVDRTKMLIGYRCRIPQNAPRALPPLVL